MSDIKEHHPQSDDASDIKEQHPQNDDASECEIIDNVVCENEGRTAPENFTAEQQQNGNTTTPNVDENRADFEEESCTTVLNRFRNNTGKCINNDILQFLILLLIVAVSILMGIATDDNILSNPQADAIVETVELALLTICTVEVAMQIIYHGCRFFQHRYLVFDLFVVLLSWVLGFIIFPFLILLLVRCFRFLDSVRDKIPFTILLIWLKLFVNIYIFSVICTVCLGDLFEEGITSENYFGTLDRSMLTLFYMLTLDGWSTITQEVMFKYSWAWVIFIVYIIVIVDIIVDGVSNGFKAFQNKEKEELKAEIAQLNEKQVRTLQILESLASEMQKMKQVERAAPGIQNTKEEKYF